MPALLAAAKPGHPVHCNDCGQQYPQDPPFEVTCPECAAAPGQYCRRPSGHSGPFVPFHAARDLLAKALGFYGHDCIDRARDQEAASNQAASAEGAGAPAQLTLAL